MDFFNTVELSILFNYLWQFFVRSAAEWFWKLILEFSTCWKWFLPHPTQGRIWRRSQEGEDNFPPILSVLGKPVPSKFWDWGQDFLGEAPKIRSQRHDFRKFLSNFRKKWVILPFSKIFDHPPFELSVCHLCGRPLAWGSSKQAGYIFALVIFFLRTLLPCSQLSSSTRPGLWP